MSDQRASMREAAACVVGLWDEGSTDAARWAVAKDALRAACVQTDEQTPTEGDTLRQIIEAQAVELERLRRDLYEAHRVLTRLAAVQLNLAG